MFAPTAPAARRSLRISKNSSACRARIRGFTMIEVMIVVAIIAILAAIALPAYGEYVRRSKIIDATAKLASGRVKMEQWFLDKRTYAAACGTAAPIAVNTTTSADDFFAISCSNLSATTYTITATGIASKGMATAFVYTINQDNAKTSAGPSGDYTNGTCWATRKDGSCN